MSRPDIAIKRLFDNYVAPQYPDKVFSPYSVRVEYENNERHKYIYNSGGVRIEQFGRITWAYDDHDYFCDNLVVVDEFTVVNEKKV